MEIISHIYKFAGHNIKVVSENSIIHLICKAFFHLAINDDEHEYEINFSEKRKDNNSEFKMQLHEGFKLYYNFNERKLESIYNKDIFDDIDNKKGILAEYGNTYNDSKLPHNSLGVVNTINWLLESIGVFRLHSAFVKYKEKNILLTGKGSVGKTTSALNISFNGGELVSDDIVFIKLENDKVITFPSPKKIAITDKTIGFFTKLQKIKKTKFMHKYHLNEDFLFPNRLTKKGSPNILIFPTILNNENSGNIRIESIPKIKAFMSLLEGEILYPTISKETRKNQINLIDKLVKQSDCYFYFNGGDMKENFNLIRGIT